MKLSAEWNDQTPWDGAVAILEIDRHLIFIKRSLTMPTHPGQIAFVGGLRKKDENRPEATALREFEEELDFSSEGLLFCGYSAPVMTARGKVIIPCKFDLEIDLVTFLGQVKSNGEWVSIFPISLGYLHYGGLPDTYLSDDPWEELKDYAGLYLKEEIQESAFVRKIENYARFLEFAAFSSGQLLNYESLANDAFIPARTIKDYYQLLEETLIGYNLRPFKKSGGRKEISTSKFYFFDTGVLNSLTKRKVLNEKTKEFGDLFEHFIFLELKAYQLFHRCDWNLEFWRTQRQDEVDFILGGGEVIIEVKSTANIKNEHLQGLNKFKENNKVKRSILVCRQVEKSNESGIEVYPWNKFLDELWSGEIIKN